MPRKKKEPTNDIEGTSPMGSTSVRQDIGLEIKKVQKSLPPENPREINYDNLIPKHPSRENVYKKILQILTENNKAPYDFKLSEIQKFALNLERGIFNYAISFANRKEWDHVFKYYYISKAVRITSNINPNCYLKNTELIHRLFNKEFKEFDICTFNSEQLFPSRYYEIISLYEEQLPKYAEKVEPTNDGAHYCGKCKTHKTTYYQLQTRSAKIIGWKSTLLITSWLCYWQNSCSPSLIKLN